MNNLKVGDRVYAARFSFKGDAVEVEEAVVTKVGPKVVQLGPDLRFRTYLGPAFDDYRRQFLLDSPLLARSREEALRALRERTDDEVDQLHDQLTAAERRAALAERELQAERGRTSETDPPGIVHSTEEA